MRECVSHTSSNTAKVLKANIHLNLASRKLAPVFGSCERKTGMLVHACLPVHKVHTLWVLGQVKRTSKLVSKGLTHPVHAFTAGPAIKLAQGANYNSLATASLSNNTYQARPLETAPVRSTT